VPELPVARLDGDGEFALSQLASAKSPTLLWFRAPWCEVCNHEAPAIERLAANGGGELAVVAIGGRDRAANGPAFVARHEKRQPGGIRRRAALSAQQREPHRKQERAAIKPDLTSRPPHELGAPRTPCACASRIRNPSSPPRVASHRSPVNGARRAP